MGATLCVIWKQLCNPLRTTGFKLELCDADGGWMWLDIEKEALKIFAPQNFRVRGEQAQRRGIDALQFLKPYELFFFASVLEG